MLPSKFDQYFRDKLLDHSTKPSAGSWKLIHAALLRHKTFHFWKRWVAGPAVVAVAIAGYVMIAQIGKPVKRHTDISTHTHSKQAAPQARTPAANDAPIPGNASSPASTANTSGTPAADNPNNSNTPATPSTSRTAPTDFTTATPASTTATAARTSPAPGNHSEQPATNLAVPNTTSVDNSPVHKPHTPTGNHIPQRRNPQSQPGYLASATSGTGSAIEFATGSTAGSATGSATKPATAGAAVNSPRPTGLTARLTIVRPSTRFAVTTQTPNARSSKNLVVPAIPYQPASRWRVDGFAIPAYFFYNEFGFSYGAGATATYVFIKHFTITAGLEYLKVDVKANKNVDSLNGFYPGIFNNVQAPLLFGYTTGNQRFSLTVNAGAIFSLYADAKGLLKYKGWPNHNGVTSYLGFNFATHVSDRLSIFAEPYIKCWYPQKFQGLPPQLFSTGISIGLRYDLK